MKHLDLEKNLTFGFEQTFTIPEWWTDEGFTATSDTPLKREKMKDLALALTEELKGSYRQSEDIWGHMQYETFDSEKVPSFVVTMDPGSIEVKTQPCLAGETKAMAAPLFKAALKAGLVPYRQWWYGIRGGTEGGCHVNMGGFREEKNPLKQDPSLLVKYCAYIHNRPWLHYPFMGLDVGPEGNAMRMDEKPGFDRVKKAFESYDSSMDAEETYIHFKDTNLVNEKASFPSLAKFKPGLFLIEDRAQEALRSAEEFYLVSDLRLKILQNLKSKPVESLQSFKGLHQEKMTSYWLWEKFQFWANDLEINPVPYQRFFDRQFPKLTAGEKSPSGFWIKEGRRPRIIKSIQKRGDTIVSKTVDTAYKRFEIVWSAESEKGPEITCEGVEKVSQTLVHKGYLGFGEKGESAYLFVDVKVNQENPSLKIVLNGEEARFNMLSMMWEAF